MILDGLFRDPSLSDMLSDNQRIDRYIAVELALAEGLAPSHAQALHFGATSQDIMDTATVLEARDVLEHFEQLIRELVLALVALIQQHQQNLVAGRTRSQQAAPINLALKIARWLEPLLRQLERLKPLRQEVLQLQLAGAALRHSHTGLQHLVLNTQQMTHNLWATQGVLFAETVRFQLELAQQPNAAQLVAQCISKLSCNSNPNVDLLDLVNAQAGTAFTREGLTADLLHAGCTQEDIQRVLTHAQSWLPNG